MSKYINHYKGVELPHQGKTQFILAHIPGAIKLDTPPAIWKEDIVCVVDNGLFQAAAYCQNAYDIVRFNTQDGRPKDWLIVPGAKDIAE